MTTQTDAITLEVIDVPSRERDADGWDHWSYRVRLRFEGRQLTSPWRQGTGITTDPTAEAVLESMLSDAAGYDNSRGFEDWAAEYGYDPDSRAAEAIYRAVERQTHKLAQFLGDQ
jgi:hypothetical protein